VITQSELEDTLAFHIRAAGLPEPEREYRFHPVRRWRFDFAVRRWRFDFAYPDKMIAIECEGGTWSGGRHSRGQGFEDDCIKYNTAAIMGWVVLRFTGKLINNWYAISVIEEALESS